MGLLRFLLASLVLMSHLSIGFHGYNLGVMAVIVFYLLAGQVVVRLWARMRTLPNCIGVFARDRLLRILPQYFVGLGLSTLVWLYFAPTSEFLPLHPSVWDWLANLTVIPLNFFMYTGLTNFMLIPPAWSLGAELQFYLLTPLLFSWGTCRLGLIFLGSIAVFLLAQTGTLHTDYYGYRLLPGILFIFLLGSALAEQSPLHPKKSRHWAGLFVVWVVMGFYALALLVTRDHQPFRLEVALGLVVGLPLILMLQKKTSPHAWSKLLSRRAGELSFGIFLYHFPVIWTLESLGQPHTGLAAFPSVMVFSTLLAAAGHWCVERPLWRYLRPRVLV
ncbi:acyltransferase family protein [Pseudomonas rhodesiae]|uniref:acyltransferase family protein n=1 Tax=Pseudomonas rhodesiae TaxID=76760 RepID=UPI00289AF5D5|nr:acyltransferase [Pseudomonas rhodesiae]